MTFKIGDKVMIDAASKYCGSTRNNPAQTVGVITDLHDDDTFNIHVRWNHGVRCENNYRARDLVMVGFGTLRNFSFI